MDATGSEAGVGAGASAKLPAARRQRQWLRPAVALLGGVGLALAASRLVLQLGTLPAHRLAQPGGVHRLAPGEQFDGEPLPPVAAISPPTSALPPTDPPLGLRQDCVWGGGGRRGPAAGGDGARCLRQRVGAECRR